MTVPTRVILEAVERLRELEEQGKTIGIVMLEDGAFSEERMEKIKQSVVAEQEIALHVERDGLDNKRNDTWRKSYKRRFK